MSEHNQIKKILMVCYHYPPSITSGVYRSLAFSLNLQGLGWQPTVLTVVRSFEPWIKRGGEVPSTISIVRAIELPLATIADLSNALLSKLVKIFGKELRANYFREIFCIPDAQISWCFWRQLLRQAKSVDCVYVSCSPFSSAVVCALLKPLYKKELIVDFRDIWAIPPRNSRFVLRSKITRLMEHFTLSRADKLILNTKGTLALYRQAYPEFRDKMFLLPNGFDEVPTFEKLQKRDEFVIMHVGSLYQKRDPSALILALVELNLPKIKFVQIGGDIEIDHALAKNVAIETHPPVAHEQALALLSQADLLYLNQGDDDTTAVAGKTFEYLASGLPILAECPAGDNADLLKRYGIQLRLVNKGDKESIKSAILHFYQEGHRGQRQVNGEFLKKFNRRNLTEALASIIEQDTAGQTDNDFY